ncbi:hypothetical protein ATKI12_6625 [Kitasatospora sp. Ki12]
MRSEGLLTAEEIDLRERLVAQRAQLTATDRAAEPKIIPLRQRLYRYFSGPG